jgi:hypothetical protein
MGLDPSSELPVNFDPTDPDFIEAYLEELHHPHEDDGVDFWWLDWQQGGVTRIPGLDPLWLLNHFHYLDSARNGRRPLTFGTVYQWSSHTVLLRLWLKEHGVDPDTEVEMVVVPPSQMVPHLRAGHIDGFCAGEPWNSLAVMSGAGWVVARSAQLAPLHPEKVLMVRGDFAKSADDEHVRLIAALLEAARFCDDAANRERIAETLARPEYAGASPEAIRRSMRGVYDYGNDRVEPCAGFNIFARDNASEPDEGKARWVTQSLIASGLATARQLPPRLAQRCFRPDIFARAAKLVNPSSVSSAA